MASVIVKESMDLDKLIQRMKDSDKVFKTALKLGSAPVAKDIRRRAPREIPNLKFPDEKPLAQTITTKVTQKGTVFTANTGPTAPHARLLEYGHAIVSPGGEATGSRVPGKEFMAPAIDTMQSQSEQITEKEIADGLARLSK